LAVCLLVSAAGCSDGIGQVRGRLTIDGKPAPTGLILEFQPQSKAGPPSYGRTDGDGGFELWQSGTKKGLVIGPCLVRISIPPVDTSGPGRPPSQPAELRTLVIPDRYNTASNVTFDIKPGPQAIDIDVVTKP
jgi:hypothetical protein